MLVESFERKIHRCKCKAYNYGFCSKYCGFSIECTPNCHILTKCRRMRIYDTQHGLDSSNEYDEKHD